MTYRVVISGAAEKDLRRIRDRTALRRLSEAVEALADDPPPPHAGKLRGVDNVWRIGWVTAHTLAKLQTAFYAPKLLDNASFEQWTADGALDANQRGLRRAQEMLGSYEPLPMDEAVRAFIARREEELPEGVE